MIIMISHSELFNKSPVTCFRTHVDIHVRKAVTGVFVNNRRCTGDNRHVVLGVLQFWGCGGHWKQIPEMSFLIQRSNTANTLHEVSETRCSADPILYI